MAGFTDGPMRRMAQRFGAERTYTEMVNARAVGDGAATSLRLLERMEGEENVVAHLYGNVPAEFARAAEIVEGMGGFSGIDINCGCPAPKVAHCGAGAALMRSPALIADIVRETVTHTRLPVSIKTRLGFAEERDHRGSEDRGHREDERGDLPAVFEIARRVADAGAASIAVHARYAEQFHTGEVHYGVLERLVKESPIPVIGNGGIANAETAWRMRETGVAGIMVGWAAVGNPWIFEKIEEAEETEEIDSHRRRSTSSASSISSASSPPRKIPIAEVRAVLMEHLELSMRHKRQCDSKYPGTSRVGPEEGAALDFRCQLFRYLNGMKGVSRLRARLHSLDTLDIIIAAVNEVLAVETEFRAKVGLV